jgi:hypothetical protein
MVRNEQSADRPKDVKAAEHQAVAGHGDSCRCKETADMKPRELLKLMISDLAFWKKAKK